MMKKEIVNYSIKESSVKIQASEINSLRVKDIDRNAVRVYKDGLIGISGAVGSSSIEELTEQAIENLSSKIPYPYEIESNTKDHRNYTQRQYDSKELMSITKTMLESFNHDYNDFILNGSTKKMEIDYKITNSEGLDLRYQDSYVNIDLLVKAKDSPNLFDYYTGWRGRNLDVDRYIAKIKSQLQADRTKVELPKGKRVPVFFADFDSVSDFLTRNLNGEIYGNKSSLFDGKIGAKLFDEKVTIIQNKDSRKLYSSFYDTEGTTKDNDEVVLIENGVLKRVFTDKKNAAKFGLEHTSSASGEYDDIPRLGYAHIESKRDSKDIQKTLDGNMAILVLVVAGGEFNADGIYGTPVQASYLFDGKKLIGILPEFNMNNDIYSMLGKDYIGTFSSEDLYLNEDGNIFGCYMNIIE
jgi:PmbA protein